MFGEFRSRGLGAVRDLRRGELILRVPKSALMTTENIMEDKKLSLAVNNHPYLLSAQVYFLTVLLFTFYQLFFF